VARRRATPADRAAFLKWFRALDDWRQAEVRRATAASRKRIARKRQRTLEEDKRCSPSLGLAWLHEGSFWLGIGALFLGVILDAAAGLGAARLAVFVDHLRARLPKPSLPVTQVYLSPSSGFALPPLPAFKDGEDRRQLLFDQIAVARNRTLRFSFSELKIAEQKGGRMSHIHVVIGSLYVILGLLLIAANVHS
jgi:hypothetical protein